MDPSLQACPNLACPDKGTIGGGTIRIPSRTERRYQCRTCRRTFVATANTPLYRLHHPAATLTVVLTLLVHGCPIPAIVAAFGLDERTVRAWLQKAGAHAAALHDRMVADVDAQVEHRSPTGAGRLTDGRLARARLLPESYVSQWQLDLGPFGMSSW